MSDTWTCLACGHENEELAEACDAKHCPLGEMSKPDGREYARSACCDRWIPKYWVHPKVDGCYGCMDLDDYLRRVSMIDNPWERSAWIAKHDAEIQSMPQADIEQIMDAIYMSHQPQGEEGFRGER